MHTSNLYSEHILFYFWICPSCYHYVRIQSPALSKIRLLQCIGKSSHLGVFPRVSHQFNYGYRVT